MQAAMQRAVVALALAPAPAKDFEEQTVEEQSALAGNQHSRADS